MRKADRIRSRKLAAKRKRRVRNGPATVPVRRAGQAGGVVAVQGVATLGAQIGAAMAAADREIAALRLFRRIVIEPRMLDLPVLPAVRIGASACDRQGEA